MSETTELAKDIAAAEERTALAAAISSLKPIVEASYRNQSEAKRRLYRARDRVEHLKRDLAEAEVALIAADRDFEHENEWMQLVWADFRRHVEKIPVVDA